MKKTSDIIWQDDQHQELFRIIDSLNGPSGEYSLSKLINYVKYHFSLEEVYMEKLKYPDIELHIKAHNDFKNKIETYINSQVEFNKTFAKELSYFLSGWLLNHVFTIDKDLEDFIIKSKEK